MFTLTIFTLAAALVCFFGGGFWLAAAVTGIVVAKLFPVAAIFSANRFTPAKWPTRYANWPRISPFSYLPLIPMQDIVERRTFRRLEIGAQGVGDGDQGRLHEFVGNAQ